MKYALTAMIAFGFIGMAHADERKISWSCHDTGKNSQQCQIKNTGSVDASVCMDVVKVCSDGDHVTRFCSEMLRPGEVDTKVVSGFEPKVRLLVRCMGTEYRNKNFFE